MPRFATRVTLPARRQDRLSVVPLGSRVSRGKLGFIMQA